MVNRLRGTEQHFRGAIWELYWLSFAKGLSRTVEFEFGEAPGGKTVDFLMKDLGESGVALEATCLSEQSSTVAKRFYLDDLMSALIDARLLPFHVLTMSFVRSTDDLPDVAQVVNEVEEWAEDVSYGRVGTDESTRHTLRLALEPEGWRIDFEATLVGREKFLPGRILGSAGGGFVIDLNERIRERLTEKGEKAQAVPSKPLIIAVSETGGFSGGGREHRVSALFGSDQITWSEKGESRRGRRSDGFFLGPEGWRNGSVSAVAFTDRVLPDFEGTGVEIWLNAGATHGIDYEVFASKAGVVALVNSQLVERKVGDAGTDWTPVVLS